VPKWSKVVASIFLEAKINHLRNFKEGRKKKSRVSNTWVSKSSWKFKADSFTCDLEERTHPCGQINVIFGLSGILISCPTHNLQEQNAEAINISLFAQLAIKHVLWCCITTASQTKKFNEFQCKKCRVDDNASRPLEGRR